MDIQVHMLAFGTSGEIRIVNLPDCDLPQPLNEILDLVFHYGQNDFQPKEHCSVSVGDVIEYNDTYFRVARMGFKVLSKEEFEKYKFLSYFDNES